MANGDPGYVIIAQELTEELTPGGRFVDQWRVTFQTPSGIIGYVRVPADQYTPDNVQALISAQVQNVEAVHALGAPAAGTDLSGV